MSAASRGGLLSRLRLLSIGQRAAAVSPATRPQQPWRALSTDAVEAEVSGRVIEAKPRVMTPQSKRTGAIAIKCGMTALWDKWGARVPISVLWLDDNIVSQVKTPEKEGISALQIGCSHKKEKHLTKPEVGHFRAQGVPMKRKLKEFPVTEDGLLPVGTSIDVRHFVPGQYVDVTGITRGKGFQGGMKTKPNISCFSTALSALASLKALRAGRTIHAFVLKLGSETNPFIGSSLVDLYCKCGHIEDGCLAFHLIQEKNVVCWNSMVAGYSLNGYLEEARELFDQIPKKNNVSWNSLMTGYLGGEEFDKLFGVFNEMSLSGEQPNKSTFSIVLCACANLASLEKGENLHGKVIKLGFEYDVFVDTALLDMYAKSGSIESSRKIFERMPKKNAISWTAMIQGLAENGFAEESLALFEQMEQTTSFSPNEHILLAVLFACSHCGLVDKGLYHFNSMQKVYGVKPNERHYTCVVDMLSRSGRLLEAEKFISSIPYEPEANTWAALLSGCRTYGNEIMAERVSRKLSESAEKKSGGYVLLSNVYASAGRWMDVLNTRKSMQDKGLKKSGGFSWIEVRNQPHLFYSLDGSHAESAEIYGVLELLNSEMQILTTVSV